jgi:acyl-CoA thioester hydrolase
MATIESGGRNGYPYIQSIGTRWKDNDLYGHLNNVEYYSFFDTLINSWLIKHGGLDIHKGEVIGVCAESHCKFLSSLSFPEVVEGCLRLTHLGRSSVRYEIGLFPENSDKIAAEGWFVHVFVSRETRRPEPIPDSLRKALKTLLTREGE